MSIGERGQGLSSVASGVAFLVGAGAYTLADGPGGADFNLTPLFVGTIAIVAGLCSRRRMPAARVIAWAAARTASPGVPA